jgi:environmental stress-induced protein Ves
VTLVRAADCPPAPWANGGGRTRELARRRADAGQGQGFDWRLSLAEIERSGPFSPLPGVDRVFAPVRGRVRLTFANHAVTLGAGDRPLAFDGGQPPQAEPLDGAPCAALNLMLARGRCAGALRPVRVAAGQAAVPLRAAAAEPIGAVRGWFVVRGRLHGAAGEAGDDCLWLDDAGDAPPVAAESSTLLELTVTCQGPR